MFKKFIPKEDISSSTSLKSSVQRNIRQSLLEQLPYLSQPAYRDRETSSKNTETPSGGAVDAPPPDEIDEDPLKEDIVTSGSGKKEKGKGKGKGKGKSGGKSKGQEDVKEDKVEEEEVGCVLDDIWPKKEALGLTKCHDRISIYTVQSNPLFFNHFDGPYIPTLKLLHQHPGMLPHVQIDRGAIKFLLAGANMMAPGFLSAGGNLPDGLDKDRIVAIHAEGKEHACGIGKMSGSSQEIKEAGKGVAVEVLSWIGDDLWKVDSIGL